MKYQTISLWLPAKDAIYRVTIATTELFSYIHTYIHTHIHTYIHTYTHTMIHTYIDTYINTYIHTYIHTYILYLNSSLSRALPPSILTTNYMNIS